MRKPVVITSLDEDLRAIGLLPPLEESASKSEPEPAPEETPEETPVSKTDKLMEDVADIVDGVRPLAERERIKGFANVAVIADTLSERFAQMGVDLEEDTLVDVALTMEALSEKAADRVLWLENRRGDVPLDKIKRTFEGYMADLLDALQLYSDITTGDGLEEMDDEEDGEPADEEKTPVNEFDDDEDELDEEDLDEDDEAELGEADDSDVEEAAEGEADEGVQRAKDRLEDIRKRLAEERLSGKGQRPLSALKRRGRRR